MELPSEEGEMALPLNSSYGHGHVIHHHHHPSSHNHIILSSVSAGNGGPPVSSTTTTTTATATIDDDFKKMIRYRECLKNHAASMGGNATDGCGEFMPAGEEGTLEALTCSACNCHRNFHRKEIEGEPDNWYHNNMSTRMGRKLMMGPHNAAAAALGYHHGALRAVAPHPMIMPYGVGGGGGGSDQSDQQDTMARPPVKKRFRTKFTPEQKEKMLGFAEKVGWKIQKQEEGVVQQFCQEVGVKRRVLKVWMHNNKHNLANKINQLQSHHHNQL